MPLQISQADMHYFASAIWALARSESADAQAALAWLILNRMETAADALKSDQIDRNRYGDGTLTDACNSVLTDEGLSREGRTPCKTGFGDNEYCRAFSVACRVWNGDQVDPANGALDFHHHYECPEWATDREPSALIGSRFFYP
ncbi:MAG: cell wall hydrolase [Rhizobiales bacterium]|nr:cell wall hydrolase [Hyphomicrobiales bacterium]